jgi:hypothetical protein
MPGFVQLDFVSHEGGTNIGVFCFVLDITDERPGGLRSALGRTRAEMGVLGSQGCHRVALVSDTRDQLGQRICVHELGAVPVL